MIVDFHTHTTMSDGELGPEALLQRAYEHGVELLAITDHDCIDGYIAVRERVRSLAVDGKVMRLISGVEFSCVWSGILIHIVGLNFDSDDPFLQEVLAQQQISRMDRAKLIGKKLEKYGFIGGFEYAAKLAGESQIGRPHFARFLVEMGYVDSIQIAFKKYLGAGKPGDIKHTWPTMACVVKWIKDSGGTAVVAHPLHYKITATKLRALLGDFKSAGGEAIEVISGRQAQDKTQYVAQLAEQFDLLASIGSDFHKPGASWSEIGNSGSLPSRCNPVWSVFGQ
ncbi:MAG: putative metal-dependent phosphoesterase TrpH [Oceanicoccus sp.]